MVPRFVGVESGQRNRCRPTPSRAAAARRCCAQVRRDDVIARIQDALEGDIERVGAIERENESLGRRAVKELIEPMPAVVEDALGRQRHLVPAATGIGEFVRAKRSMAL